MISVGIVSVQKKKGILSGLGAKNLEVKKSFGTEVIFVPVEVSSVFSSASAIGRAILKRRIKSAERFLVKMGVNIITHSNESETDTCCKINIPSDELLNCFVICMKKYGVKSNKSKLIIIDKELVFADADALSTLCLYAQNITLKTRHIAEAEKTAEKIFTEFGVWIEVEDCVKNFKASPSSMMIDADKGIIRVADLIVDGIDYGIDFGNYKINTQEVTEKIKKLNKLQIKHLKSGSNLLKIS